MKHWSGNKFCYYPAGSRFAFETKFINKKLSNEFGFKVYLGLSRCMKGGHTHNHVKNAEDKKKRRDTMLGRKLKLCANRQ